VALIAEHIRGAAIVDSAPRLVRVTREAPLVLSLAQERMWKYCKTLADSGAYVLGMADRILGPLDVGIFRECLEYIVRRHEILRATFSVVDEQPAHVIQPAGPIELPVVQLPNGVEPEAEATRILRAGKAGVRDLTQGPLFRFVLMRVSEDEHWLLRICHHLLWDGGCGRVLFDELALLYKAKLDRTAPPLPETEPLGYVDYAAWQRKLLHCDGPAYQKTIAWWKQRFEQQWRVPDPPFKRSTPVGSARPMDGLINRYVDTQLAQRIDQLRDNEGSTIYLIWLAAFVVLMAAETGQPEVVVGSYVTNRRHAQLQKMIGCFANLAALCFRVDDAMSFREWLSQVRSCVTEAEAHADIPHEELWEGLQELGVNPPEIRMIFGAPMDFKRSDMHVGDLMFTRTDFSQVAVMPWSFSMNLLEYNDAQVCRARFNAQIFDPDAVRRFMDCLHEFLNVVSQRLDLPIGELLLLRGRNATSGKRFS
jgi:hypothetical protein